MNRKKYPFALLTAVVLLSLAGCAAAAQPQQTPEQIFGIDRLARDRARRTHLHRPVVRRSALDVKIAVREKAASGKAKIFLPQMLPPFRTDRGKPVRSRDRRAVFPLRLSRIDLPPAGAEIHLPVKEHPA